jgi:hypothetical protein
MAKILLENKWYEEIAPTGQYESVYEAMIKAQAERRGAKLFKTLHV